MALSLRGTAFVIYDNNGLDMTVTHPGGIAENDVVYLAYNHAGEVDVDMLVVSPSGYTELADLYSDDTVDANGGYYRKVMGATPDSTVTVDHKGGLQYSVNAVEHVWSGVDTTTPEDATTTTATDTNSSLSDSPSITTVTANAIILTVGAVGVTNLTDATKTEPTGYSNPVVAAHSGSSGWSGGCWMASKLIASPGAENPGAWSGGTSNNDSAWTAATIAIRPAAGAAAQLMGQAIL